MSLSKRLHILLKVAPIVVGLLVVKLIINRLHLEFITADGLVPSLVAGAIFLIGFLLSHVMAHYKDAERMPGEMRAALEAIHDDIAIFARTRPEIDVKGVRRDLRDIVATLQKGLGIEGHHNDLAQVEGQVDGLSDVFWELEKLGMPEPYIVRLRGSQDILRRTLFRISYVQTMESVPSMRLLVQTLVVACLILMLFIRTEGSYESFMIVAFVSYLFVYALCLIQVLEEPFRTGEGAVDDVSLYLLRDFAKKLAGQTAPSSSDRDQSPAHDQLLTGHESSVGSEV
jgi:hypothetical protein